MEDAEKLQAQNMKNQTMRKIAVPILIKDGKPNLQESYNGPSYWPNVRADLSVPMHAADFRTNEICHSPDFRTNNSNDMRINSSISPEYKPEINSGMPARSNLNDMMEHRQQQHILNSEYRSNFIKTESNVQDCSRLIKTEYKMCVNGGENAASFPDLKNVQSDSKQLLTDRRMTMDTTSGEYGFTNYLGPPNYQMQYINYMEQIPGAMDQNLQRLW